MSFTKLFGEKVKENRELSVDEFYPFSKEHNESKKILKSRHYSPLKGIKKLDMRIGAFDIETKEWQDDRGMWHDARDLSDPDRSFSFGSCMWIDNNGDTQSKVFYNRVDMGDFMIKSKFKHYHWWGFASGRFDLIGIYHTGVLNEKKFRVLYRNGSIIQLTYLGKPRIEKPKKNVIKRKSSKSSTKRPKVSYPNKIYFNDLRLITGKKLADIGDALGLQKLESEKRAGGFEEITQEDIDYNLRDSEIVLRFVQEMAHLLYDKFKTKMKFTIASIASTVYRTGYLSDIFPDGFRVNEVDRFFRDSYYGGRVELFDKRLEELDVVGYDVNSLYPFVMREYEYPDPSTLRYYSQLPPNWQKMMGMVHGTVYVPEELKDSYPILPFKTEEGKLIFPVGVFKGAWNVVELLYAMKYGCKLLDVDYAVLTSVRVRPFTRFVNELYGMRMKYKALGNKVYELMIKIILNSSYGKFAQRVKHEEFGRVADKTKLTKKGNWFVITNDPTSDYGIWVEVDKNGVPIEEDSPQDVICWASTITSYARIELHKRIMTAVRKGHRVIYSDTDSLFIEEKGKESLHVLEIGKALGKVKIEHHGHAVFYAPKIYKIYEVDEGKYVYKHKGVSDNFNWSRNSAYLHRGERIARPDTDEEWSVKGGGTKHHGFSWDSFSGSFVNLCNLSDLVRNRKPLGGVSVVDRRLSAREEKRNWNGSRGYAKVLNQT